MNNRATHANLMLLRQTAQVLGVDLPEPLAQAIADHEQLETKLRDFQEQPIDLPGAILAAARAGKDPAADRQVQRALAATQLVYQVGAVTDLSIATATQAAAEQFPALIDALRVPFQDAVSCLHSSHDVLGSTDLDDAKALVSRGPAAVEAWHNAQKGITVLRQIVEAWSSPYTRLGASPINPQHRVFIVAQPKDGDYAAYCRLAHVDRPHFAAWDAAQAGWTFDLADANEFERRVQQMYTWEDNERNSKLTQHDIITLARRNTRLVTLAARAGDQPAGAGTTPGAGSPLPAPRIAPPA